MPLEFSPKINKFGKLDMSVFKLNKNKKVYMRLIDRNNLKGGVVQTFELPSHYIFHYANSFESINKLGERVIKI